MRNDSPPRLRRTSGVSADVPNATLSPLPQRAELVEAVTRPPEQPVPPLPMTDADRVTLLGAVELRRLAAELDLRPTKMLGQNFVHDANTVRRIVSAAKLAPSAHVLEIGPGLGSLTLGLLEAVATVTAVEIDPRLAALLPVTVAAHAPSRAGDLTVLTADALVLRHADLQSEPTALVANLPYNVAVPVLLHLLAELPSLRRVLVMVQAEVADRLAAPPGSRTYGSPSAKAAWFGMAKRAGAIGRSVFWPVPGVDSALVSIDLHAVARSGDRGAVFSVIDAAFAQRRKTLRAALSGWAGSPARAETLLRRAGVEPGLRGEMLDVDAFARIAEAAAGSAATTGEGEAAAATGRDAATGQDPATGRDPATGQVPGTRQDPATGQDPATEDRAAGGQANG